MVPKQAQPRALQNARIEYREQQEAACNIRFLTSTVNTPRVAKMPAYCVCVCVCDTRGYKTEQSEDCSKNVVVFKCHTTTYIGTCQHEDNTDSRHGTTTSNRKIANLNYGQLVSISDHQSDFFRKGWWAGNEKNLCSLSSLNSNCL